MASIRLAEDRDARAVAEIYRPYVERSAISFELEAPAEEETKRRMAVVLTLAPWILFEEQGGVLGYAYASKHRDRAAYQWSVDVSVYVAEGHHRRGIGRALYGSLFALLRLQGFYTAHAGITLPNAASVALHEALGFGPVGVYRAVGHKFQAWHDVGWWQLALRDRVGTPSPPLTVTRARSLAGWEPALGAGLERPFGAHPA
jgi:phosphinothricin acetyltransferase